MEDSMSKPYSAAQPERSEVDAMEGVVALEFGTDWCGYCRAGSPLIAGALNGFSNVKHIKVEDGPGRKLGRSFKVKLWPTLVLVKGGHEIARVVRPDDTEEVRQALASAQGA
jgi:thioredoxin 1